jgi:anti-anti-sigma regulatory factor
MGIQKLSEDVILVELPHDCSKRSDELKKVNETVGHGGNCHVLVDFSAVEILNSWNISNLLILRDLLQGAGRQLILCNITTVTKCIFAVAGLSEVFTFADDRFAALDMIQNSKSSTPARS